MGYYINSRGCNFVIKAKDMAPALEALKKEMKKGGHWSWVQESNISKATTLQEALTEFMWPMTILDKKHYKTLGSRYFKGIEIGDAIRIEFTGEKMGSEEELFTTLAPYIQSGSWIEISGEEDNIWRYCFQNGRMTEKYSKIVWEDYEAILHKVLDRVEEMKQIPLFLKLNPALDGMLEERLKKPLKQRKG